MKKIMFMAAALLTFAGCAEKEVDTPEEPDSISLSPKSEHVVPGKGGDVSVMVNSSTDWVLEGEHGLVEPSALSGSDEDVVTFTVKANLGEETAAEFTFVAGKATAPLTIKILKADAVLDELTLSAANHEFGVGGDEFSITVLGSQDWTVAPKVEEVYEWVRIKDGLTGGKNNQQVTFVADKNDTGEERTAGFVFSCGNAEPVEFTITQLAGVKPVMTVTSDNPVEVAYTQSDFDVLLSLSENIEYNGITCNIEQEGEWLTKSIPLSGDAEHTAKFEFDALQNDGLMERRATVTFSYEGADDVTVTVIQKPKTKIETELMVYNIPGSGDNLKISVSANVEYEITYSEGAEEWLTNHITQENVEKWTCVAMEGNGKRTATITFTEANPAAGAEPIQTTVTVIQSNYLINMVARMNNSRAQFADLEKAKACEAFKLGKSATIEALVNIDEDNFNGVTVIAGIEARFLIRYNDNHNFKFEAVFARTTLSPWGGHEELKVFGGDLPRNEWIHLAVTVGEDNKIKLYKNGEVVGEEAMPSDFMDIDLRETYDREGFMQQFSFGWAYDDGRYWHGQMSEIRIWNRPLSQTELKSDNHFYTVPAVSEGLVGYWKLDNASNGIFLDETSFGNNLRGQKLEGGIWKDGLTLEEVGLPE